VVSFPETHFFSKVVTPNRRGRIGLASRQAGDAIEYLIGLGLLTRDARTRRPLTVRGYARLLRSTLDSAASQAGTSHWLEKTPNHLHYVGEIERYIRNAKMIHMIRSGRAVVASLYQVSREHPDVWGPQSIDALTETWRSDLHRSRSCIGRRNHAFVSYERLVADPRSVLRRLCAFLDLPLDDATLERMLTEHAAMGAQTAGYVRVTPAGPRRRAEPWKDDLNSPLRNRNTPKFEALFTSGEQEVIGHAVAREDATIESFPFL
jgi:hypothetical protein